MRELYLRPGMIINNGSVIIKDEDRLCYLVRSDNKGAVGLRTISKKLLAEFISYIKINPNASGQEARLHLSGKSEIDRFEYGYNATLVQMAKQAIMLENQHISNKHKIEKWLLKSSQTARYIPILSALRTKPFLLLAGISGTGKSRIVRRLARAVWEEGNPNRTAQSPENFIMIPVKPNWHDSSELIGYKTNLGEERFIAGDFLKFIVKAWSLNKKINGERDIPCFVCLDEMNLAPVEQYFAEYLSCIESRERHGDEIRTDALLRVRNVGLEDKNHWYYKLIEELAGEAGLDTNKDHALFRELLDNGFTIPSNLIVIGTVNMDETTFAFSRKVLDRAMTIEMNQVNLRAGLGEEADELPDLSSVELLSTWLTAEDVYEDDDNRNAVNEILGWLEEVNDTLEGSPFKIAYRTRNEVIIYVMHCHNLGKDRLKAFDEAVCMKILPRIEGDKNKVGDVLTQLEEVIICLYSSRTEETQKDDEQKDSENADMSSSPSLAKLKEMREKMKRQYYCTYWS